jgi:hypothetical protein
VALGACAVLCFGAIGLPARAQASAPVIDSVSPSTAPPPVDYTDLWLEERPAPGEMPEAGKIRVGTPRAAPPPGNR